ncbi:MAG: CehA/McbA family metallohydrolase [Candidatus Hydrogenedentes bacterium]|nr:CehA/McbA family metallohydrolase [Candidatus Hydrogenedentota bacterium]
MKILSPYLNESIDWRRGNLHAHTTRSDGDRPPQDLIDRYAELGYDFLMISDHDMITESEAFDCHGMTLIPGNEVTINGPHILHVDARAYVTPDADRQVVLSAIAADSAFAIMAHPNWERHFNHCPQNKLESWQGYLGVEIYNGLVRMHAGNPLATDRWDMLLGSGRRVWGFANDDAHQIGDEGVAWNMVQSDSKQVTDLVAALRAGRFYASTGVIIDSIRLTGNVIRIATQNAQRIVVTKDFGRCITHADAASFEFTVGETLDATYVRFECFGHGESMAWTQPIFIESEAQ